MNTASSTIAAFAEQAASFCAWCEGEALGHDASIAAAIWLARLHASALSLPQTQPEYGDNLPELSFDELRNAERNLRSFDGTYYRTIFDPNPKSNEDPVMGDVGDDLLDTYKDLKRGLLLYRSEKVEHALWFWSYMHRLHWGKHAVGALAALQSQDNAREA